MWYRLLDLFWDRPISETATCNTLQLYTAYSRSWLGRYLPGRIWMFGGRLLLAARNGLPSEAVIRSMAFENLWGLGTTAVIGTSLFLFASSQYLFATFVLVLGLSSLAGGVPLVQRILDIEKLITNTPTALRPAAHFSQRILVGNKPLTVRGSITGVMVFGLHSCSQLAFIVLLSESFVHLTLEQSLAIAGAWGISTILGFFVFIAPGPSGLGVRDGIALLLFSQVIDLPMAGIIVGVSRMIMIFSDIAFVGIIEVVVIGKKITKRAFCSPVGV
jgi:hypothetical protein